MKISLSTLSAALLVLTFPTAPTAAEGSSGELFPRPAELEGDVQFWIRVYTEVGTDGGFIHDARDLKIVYEVLRFPSGASARTRARQVEKAKDRYRDALRSLAGGRRDSLSDDERHVLELFPDDVDDETLRAASHDLRFQLGQADKFRAGLIRSGAWRDQIVATLRQMGLPEELVALPHVESSYSPHAFSRVGAAGLWQFTRSTGRRYMRVDHVVDERMDPVTATIAAARLLQHNKNTTGTWPLALTAYNHGAAGMRRAARQMGTTDIAVIARKYRSRTFGFASRNFYAEFLAALDVDRNPERYFGALAMAQPVEYESVTLPDYVPVSSLVSALGIDRDTLRDHNPALRTLVWNGSKHVPKGYELRVPRARLAKPLHTLLASVPAAQRHARQTRDTYHHVDSGETLSAIASRYHVSIDELVAMNGLRNRHSIRAGQRLRLPPEAGSGTQHAAIAPPSTPPGAAPAPEEGLYRVRSGDSIWQIATRFGVTERELMEWNDIRDRNRIHVGQTLRVASRDDAIADAIVEVAPEPIAPTAPIALAEVEEPLDEPLDVVRAEPLEEPLEDPLDEPGDEPTPAVEGEVAPAVEYVAQTQQPGLAETTPAEDEGPLQADPNDYSVAADDTIEIQAAETLGHYAEWLGVRASHLRSINGMRYGTPLTVGQRIRLDFAESSREEFEARRREHHQAMQQAFFDEREIVGTETHVVRRGDSIWTLAKRDYDVPLWLVRQYNPDVDLADLHAGQELAFPTVRAK